MSSNEFFRSSRSLSENKRKRKYLNLVRELKKLGNIKVTLMPIIDSTLDTIPKGFEKRLEELEIRDHIDHSIA